MRKIANDDYLRSEDQFPMGLVLIYVVLVFAGIMYVQSVNASDSDRIETCIKSDKCVFDEYPVN